MKHLSEKMQDAKDEVNAWRVLCPMLVYNPTTKRIEDIKS